jgi:hypothetical protein
MFMSILMFNLLVALMVDSQLQFSRRSLASWRLEQAAIILEEQSLSTMKVAIPESLHVLELESRISESAALGSIPLDLHKTLIDIELVSKGRRDEADILRNEMNMKFESIVGATEDNKSKLDESTRY